MYTIEMTAKQSLTDKQKTILAETVKEADAEAECRFDDMSCRISGSSEDLKILSYFMGIAMGGSSLNQIVKLQVSYEKNDHSMEKDSGN